MLCTCFSLLLFSTVLTLFGSDWERHLSCAAPACWIPGARDTTNDLSPRDTKCFMEPTRVLQPYEDLYPEFTFISPLLSSGPLQTASSPQLPAFESPSPSYATCSTPDALTAPTVPNSLLVPTVVGSHLGSPVLSTLSATVVGSLTAPSTTTTANSSPKSAPSPTGPLTKVKKWARKVWRRLKTRSSGT